MELTALGTSGGWPGAGRAASGYLLSHDGFNVVLDLGTGTLSRLQELLDLDELGGIVISHGHYDHFLDLYPLFIARFYEECLTGPIPVLAPPGFFEKLFMLTDDGGADMRSVLEPREIQLTDTTELGPLRIDTRPMTHLIPTIGMRLSANGMALAYTGDTGESPEVETLAHGADLLLAEAAQQDTPEPLWFHLTARQAAIHATRAGAGRLVLSHFWPTHDREVSREQAAEAFDGDLVLFDEGATVQVSS
ncbi:MAG: MBL fold metallo-hydrolase [Actinomycetota bacterium]